MWCSKYLHIAFLIISATHVVGIAPSSKSPERGPPENRALRQLHIDTARKHTVIHYTLSAGNNQEGPLGAALWPRIISDISVA